MTKSSLLYQSVKNRSPMSDFFTQFSYEKIKKMHYAISQMPEAWHYAYKFFQVSYPWHKDY